MSRNGDCFLFGRTIRASRHGNAKHTFQSYIRSSHEEIEHFGRRHKEQTSKVFQEETMIAAFDDLTPPRNRQQVADAKYRERKACGVADVCRTANFAQVYYICLYYYLSYTFKQKRP